MTLQYKSAREVLTMVKNEEVTRLAALSHAIGMRDSLKARNKNLRASLWDKTIDSLGTVTNAPEPAITVKKTPVPSVKKTPEEKLAMGMVKKKVDGCIMYIWPTEFWSLGKNGYALSKAKAAQGLSMLMARP